MHTWYEICLRLVVSALIGAIIGFEREKSNRPAGLRTHILVTVGSALIMLISIGGFGEAYKLGDPGRMAAQVVSGIGFLGAGTIFKSGGSITGLTTAASLWVCGCIGLGIGAGYYIPSLLVTAIAILTLSLLGLIERGSSPETIHHLTIYFDGQSDRLTAIKSILSAYSCELVQLKLNRQSGPVIEDKSSFAVFSIGLKDVEALEGISDRLFSLNDQLILDWQQLDHEVG